MESSLHSVRSRGATSVVYASGSEGNLRSSPGNPLHLRSVAPGASSSSPVAGAPVQAEFAELTDWSKHSDPGIRHFSGTATYTTQFDWNPRLGTGTTPSIWGT